VVIPLGAFAVVAGARVVLAVGCAVFDLLASKKASTHTERPGCSTPQSAGIEGFFRDISDDSQTQDEVDCLSYPSSKRV